MVRSQVVGESEGVLMAVRITVFRKASDRRAWQYALITQAQRDKLFLLFGPKFRVTDHKEMFGQYSEFIVSGKSIILTRRGRVITADEIIKEMFDE